MMMYQMGDAGGGGLMFFFATVSWILIITLLVLAIVWLAKDINRKK